VYSKILDFGVIVSRPIHYLVVTFLR